MHQWPRMEDDKDEVIQVVNPELAWATSIRARLVSCVYVFLIF